MKLVIAIIQIILSVPGILIGFMWEASLVGFHFGNYHGRKISEWALETSKKNSKDQPKK